MKKTLLLLVLLFTSSHAIFAQCDAADKCNYTFLLTTSVGTSWNGGRITVSQNGVVGLMGGNGINNSAGIAFPLCNDLPFQINWSVQGTNSQNIGITVLDPYMNEIYKRLPGTAPLLNEILFSSTGNCTAPACLKPTGMAAQNTTSSGVMLSWNDADALPDTTYDLYIAPLGSPAPTDGENPTPATHPNVSNPYMVTDSNGQPLVPSTPYVFYVRKNCSANETSGWTAYSPVNFTTKPLNDECASAFSVPVNTGQVCTEGNLVHGTTRGATQSQPAAISGSGCGTIDDDIWFSFVALNTSHTISFKNSLGTPVATKTYHSLFTGNCSNLTNLYCSTNDNSTANGLTVGQTYYIRVYTPAANLTQYVNFDVCITSPPSNDDCATSVTIPVNPTREPVLFAEASTFGATTSLPTPVSGVGCGTVDDDVWFSFTATDTTHIIALSSIGTLTPDINHSVYSGACDTLTLLYCSNPNTSVAANLVVGNVYKIRVYSASSQLGNSSISFKIAVTTPPDVLNDECASAEVLPVNLQTETPIITSGSLTGATASPQSSTCAGTEDDDVWYRFTATGTLYLIDLIRTVGTGELNYSLYSATDCTNLSLVGCKTSGTSLFTLLSGQNYYIRIWTPEPVITNAAFTISVTKLTSPVTVSNPYTAAQLVSNVLINNPCVTISNVTSSTGTNFASVNGIGYFSAAPDSLFPIDSGIVLSTGDISQIPGPNLTNSSTGNDAWLGDTDLNAIIQATTGNPMNSKNASKLEFDFTTVNESMSFNFLFASEEYGQFQCDFSDAFAFLLTNLTTNVTTNLAVVPNTTIPISTVTIRNTVNNNACASVNPEYFDGYFGEDLDQQYNTAANFNGITKLMTASSGVVPGTPYHIKLVVADRQDSQYDSAVFIQAGSFSSGPPECSDKIKLISFLDTNSNGTKDDNEPSFTYGSFVYQLNDAPEINNISSPIGNYTIYDANPANSYDFSYTVNPEYQSYFNASATNYNNITIPVGSGTTTLYFPVTLLQGYNDVTVSVVPVSPPVAGMTFKNKIVYTNHGIAPTSGALTFTKDPVSTILSVSQSGIVSMPGGFTYNFTNLAPFESRSIDIIMSIPPIPTVNIDDVLSNNAIISAPANDININNNTFVNTQIVVASYDPNDKMEAHGEKIQFSTFNQNDYLTYTIRFQNTGTSNAINIRIEDLLDAKFDETSIRMVNASHNYVMNRIGNKLIWYFDYIQLPGMVVNEALSHGYVTFKIKLKPGFSIGDIVPNHAEIYFDTNPPIVTNTFNIEFVTQLGTPSFETSNVMVYPNPGNGNIQISMSQTAETIRSISLYDVLGKCVKKTAVGSASTSINVSDLSMGLYMMEITTENNLKVIKKLVVN